MDMIGDRSTLLKEGLEDPMSQAMKLCLKRIVHEKINIGNNGELFGLPPCVCWVLYFANLHFLQFNRNGG